jgi:sensor histidine kinase YesM
MTEINKQAKTFQLQAILSQMNPHFIFNVMAALQSMILSANIEKANDYLVRMSVLVRRFLEASLSTSSSKAKKSGNGELALANELEILRSFIEFQQLIYPDKFDFCLSLDSNIDTGKTTIPPMLIQPFVENAIRHGLLQKAEKGLLKLKISAEKKWPPFNSYFRRWNRNKKGWRNNREVPTTLHFQRKRID